MFNKKYMPVLINVAVAAATAYMVSNQANKGKEVVWYNPTSWF